MATEVQPPKLLPSFKYFKFKNQKPNSHKPKKKIKSFLHTNILPHVTHFAYVLVDLKCMVFDLLTKKKSISKLPEYQKCVTTKQNKLVSFIKLHLKWCPSHVTPITDSSQLYNYNYNYNFNSSVCDLMISSQEDCCEEERETQYLQWLEESESAETDMNEIDRLAEEFIASCHEKFLLEKQESYRRYQEMMARSI